MLEREALTPSSEPSTSVELGGDDVTSHHAKRPLDLIGAGRMGPVAVIGLSKLSAQPTPQSRHGPLAQRATIGVAERHRVVVSSFFQPHALVVHQRGLTSDNRNDVALGDLVHQRQEFVAHAITPKHRTVVGLVVQRREAQRRNVLVQCATAKVAQRFGGVVHHWREAVDTRAPHHVEQHRLGQVVHRVTSQHRSGHDASPRGARPGFEVPSRLDVDVVTHERDAQLRAELGHVLGVRRTRRARVVVNVVDRHAELAGQGQQQQSEGIGSSRDRQVNWRTGRWKVAFVEQGSRVEVHARRLRNGPLGSTGVQ